MGKCIAVALRPLNDSKDVKSAQTTYILIQEESGVSTVTSFSQMEISRVNERSKAKPDKGEEGWEQGAGREGARQRPRFTARDG